MAKIIWADSALNSLDEIAEYIALDNLEAAKKLVAKVIDKVDRLQDFPESGRFIPEIPNVLYREVIINPCRVIYRFENKTQTVLIVTVMRQEMDLLRYIKINA